MYATTWPLEHACRHSFCCTDGSNREPQWCCKYCCNTTLYIRLCVETKQPAYMDYPKDCVKHVIMLGKLVKSQSVVLSYVFFFFFLFYYPLHTPFSIAKCFSATSGAFLCTPVPISRFIGSIFILLFPAPHFTCCALLFVGPHFEAFSRKWSHSYFRNIITYAVSLEVCRFFCCSWLCVFQRPTQYRRYAFSSCDFALRNSPPFFGSSAWQCLCAPVGVAVSQPRKWQQHFCHSYWQPQFGVLFIAMLLGFWFCQCLFCLSVEPPACVCCIKDAYCGSWIHFSFIFRSFTLVLLLLIVIAFSWCNCLCVCHKILNFFVLEFLRGLMSPHACACVLFSVCSLRAWSIAIFMGWVNNILFFIFGFRKI